MDLNSYYQDIVRRVFSNAQIIIDRFHIIAMLTRAFNQYRAQVMKRFEKNSRQYRMLKFGWCLYLTAQDKLSDKREYYDRHLRQRVTSNERVDLGIQLDERLAADYYAIQDIMQSLKNRNLDKLAISIYSSKRLSSQMTVAINTLKQNLEYVLNASRFNYSNGSIEGNNRMIKQIERTAFGFHNLNILYIVFTIEKWHKKARPVGLAQICFYQQDLT